MNGQPDPANVPILDLDKTDPASAFRVVTDTAYLYYAPGNDRLIVSFDNLASINEPYPRLPWLYKHVHQLGYSLLGIQSHAKDWFRQYTAPQLIRSLQERGFFDGYSRIVFTGASMGGFAALNFAPLVPGTRVLAFSPQSTMNQQIAPFEKRFTWAVRNSNWQDLPFLDAAAAIPYIPGATVVFDPFVPEDRAHASRLTAEHIQMVKLSFASHEAVRVVVKSGIMPETLKAFTETGKLGAEFWTQMRARRNQRKWCRALIETAQHRHPKLTLRAAQALVQRDDYLFAIRVCKEILTEHPEFNSLITKKGTGASGSEAIDFGQRD